MHLESKHAMPAMYTLDHSKIMGLTQAAGQKLVFLNEQLVSK